MRRDDWLLGQLPVGMVEDDFFRRFVSLFQEVGGGLLDTVDGIEHVLDVDVAPPQMVRWLGGWIGADTVDPARSAQVQRRTVRTASRTLAWRGTRRGLVLFLQLLTGGDVEVEDSGGVYAEGEAPPTAPFVRVRVASSGGLPARELAGLVREQVPAHVALELVVAGEVVWPPAPAARRGAAPAATGGRP